MTCPHPSSVAKHRILTAHHSQGTVRPTDGASGACQARRNRFLIDCHGYGQVKRYASHQDGTLCALFSVRANDPSFIRLTVLTGMVASLALMSAKVLPYRPRLAIPGGRGQCARNGRPACLVWISCPTVAYHRSHRGSDLRRDRRRHHTLERQAGAKARPITALHAPPSPANFRSWRDQAWVLLRSRSIGPFTDARPVGRLCLSSFRG